MKHIYLFPKIIFLAIIFCFFSCSEDHTLIEETKKESFTNGFVNEQQAIKLAEKFINNIAPPVRSSNRSFKLAYTDLENIPTRSSSSDKDTKREQPAYYVINIDDTGYVIVSASDATLPILGYSTTSAFSADAIPPNMKSVLDGYKEEIIHTRNAKIRPNSDMKKAWENCINGISTTPKTKAAREVRPLLGTIKWNQKPYYNAYCPANCPVGCVATATAQIMRYWRYPSSGVGSHSYRSPYGTLSFNYNYTINWNQIPKRRLTQPSKETAKLCYGVAVGVNMNFSPRGSGAYQENVPNMLKKHYRYPSSVQNKSRKHYSATAWANLIRKELSAKRPVQYAGYGRGGGHSFVCDGYNARGYFHFNWGWGGSSDGYFSLSALNPGSLGIGGGSGGFNSGHTIIIGFQPKGGNPGGDPNDDPPSPSGQYCDSKSLSSSYMHISSIKVNNMTNHSFGKSYSDFTQKEIQANTKSRISYQFTPKYSYYSYPTYWRVWIDFNNNKTFEENEKVIEKYSNQIFKGNFALPSHIKKGKYRMRISMKYGGYPSPCETFNYGEVEDYTLVVRENNIPPPPTPSQKYCSSKSLSSSYMHISSIKVNNMMNYSYAKNYSDFTQKKIHAKKRSRVYYQFAGRYSYYTYPTYWRVWIDFNNNKVFEENEKVVEKYSNRYFNGSFVIPTYVKKGEYRMRISMKNGSYPSPCEEFNYGEVEDYTFRVE